MNNTKISREIATYIWCFFLFSCIGWIYESVWSSINHGYFVNKGFMYGCYLPIYGFGGVVLVLCLKNLMSKKIFLAKVNIMPILVFLAAMVIISLIEFCVSYIMELVYHRRWWDYSKVDKLHIDGRVSLRNSSILTAGSMVFLYGVYPMTKWILSKVKDRIIIVTSGVIVLVVGLDFILTVLLRY